MLCLIFNFFHSAMSQIDPLVLPSGHCPCCCLCLQLSSLTLPQLTPLGSCFCQVFFFFFLLPMLSWLTLLAIRNPCASPQPSTNHVILNLSMAISVPDTEVFEGRPCIYSVHCGVPALSTAAGTLVLDKCLLNE